MISQQCKNIYFLKVIGDVAQLICQVDGQHASLKQSKDSGRGWTARENRWRLEMGLMHVHICSLVSYSNFVDTNHDLDFKLIWFICDKWIIFIHTRNTCLVTIKLFCVLNYWIQPFGLTIYFRWQLFAKLEGLLYRSVSFIFKPLRNCLLIYKLPTQFHTVKVQVFCSLLYLVCSHLLHCYIMWILIYIVPTLPSSIHRYVKLNQQ